MDVTAHIITQIISAFFFAWLLGHVLILVRRIFSGGGFGPE